MSPACEFVSNRSLQISCRSLAIVLAMLSVLTQSAWVPANPAPEELRRAQINAARAGALDALRNDVLAAPLSSDQSVGEFASSIGVRESLLQGLQDAEQIGGTRWLDAQTCEVRLDLPGEKVADAVAMLIQDKGEKLATPTRLVKQSLDQIRRRTFSGSGMSTLALESLRPPAGVAGWQAVSADDVRRAIAAAQQDAADRLIASIRTVSLENGKTLDSALQQGNVHDRLSEWLLSRPITRADFRDNREVRVTIYAPADDLYQELDDVLKHENAPLIPEDPAQRQKLRLEISRRTEPAIGRALASGGPAVAATSPVMLMPRELPAWVGEQIEARGAATTGREARLKAAGRAEASAIRKVRQQIEALPLAAELKLGEAARRDPLIDQAIDQSLRHARVYKVNYGSDGEVEVQMSLELRDLWHELEEAQAGAQ